MFTNYYKKDHSKCIETKTNISNSDKRHKQLAILSKSKDLFKILASNWLLLNCLIQPTHNLILLALWMLKKHLLNNLFNREDKLIDQFSYFIYFYFITTSHSCFFSQGNSNSLNTIQISSGLVGINSLNEGLIAVLMFSATYASTFFWFFCTLENVCRFKTRSLIEASKNEAKKERFVCFIFFSKLKCFLLKIFKINSRFDEKEENVSYVFTYLQFLFVNSLIALYSLSSFMQREHLFVWSVFAPKLIYQLAHSSVYLFLAILACFIFTCQS